MVLTKTVWCSEDGARELLTYNHRTGQVSTTQYLFQAEDLATLEQGARECRMLAACDSAARKQEGAQN